MNTKTKRSAKTSTKAPAKAKNAAMTQPCRDKWGFKLGTKVATAATLYARKDGATGNEIAKAIGSQQKNMLKDAKRRGFKVTTKERKCSVTGNVAMAYHLA